MAERADVAIGAARRIADALAAGRTRRDVVAADGTSAATVCRRLKALALVPAMADALGAAEVPARTLAAVASWPAHVQERAARRVAEAVRKTGRLNSKAAAAVFDATARPVRRSSWVFAGEAGAERFARCANCANCSGNRPGLFDEAGSPLDGADAEGRGLCLEPRCFRRMEAAARREAVAAEIARTSGGLGAEGVVEVDCRRRRTARALRRGPRSTWAYVSWDDTRHAAEVRWGRAPA